MADLHATPIALVGQYYGASKGNKDIEAEAFNPVGRYLYLQEAKDQIDAEAARTFLELTGEGAVPAWAVQQIDVKLIRAAAK